MGNILLFLTSSFVWGSTWFAITFQLGEVDAMWSVSYRFLLAGSLMWLFCQLSSGFPQLSFKQHWRLFIQGLCLCGLSYWFVYESEKFINSGLAALLATTILYFNVLIGRIWLGNPVKRSVLVGGLLGSIGIFMVFIPEVEEIGLNSDTLKGMGFGLAGSFLLSIGCVACEQNERENLPMLPVATCAMIYGGIIMAALALISGIPMTIDLSVQYLLSLAYLVVFGSILAMTSYMALIRRIGADKAAYVDIVYPVIALIISTLFEGHEWTSAVFFGVVFILFGNIVAMRTSGVKKEGDSLASS